MHVTELINTLNFQTRNKSKNNAYIKGTIKYSTLLLYIYSEASSMRFYQLYLFIDSPDRLHYQLMTQLLEYIYTFFQLYVFFCWSLEKHINGALLYYKVQEVNIKYIDQKSTDINLKIGECIIKQKCIEKMLNA